MHSIGLLCCRSVCLSVCAYFDHTKFHDCYDCFGNYINAFSVLMICPLMTLYTQSISLSVINSDNCSAAIKLNRTTTTPSSHPPILYTTSYLLLTAAWRRTTILYPVHIYQHSHLSITIEKQSDRLIYYVHTNTFAADDSHYLFLLSNQHNHHLTTCTDVIILLLHR